MSSPWTSICSKTSSVNPPQLL